MFKPYLEQQRRYLVAADSAFPISDVLIKPYSTREAEQDPLKARFNTRLSQIRTVMTENLYGALKRRYPVVKNLRSHYPSAKEDIYCVFALNNLAETWAEPLPPDAEEDPDDPAGAVQGALDDQWVIAEDVPHRAVIRERGQHKRDQLMLSMRPRVRV